MRVPETRDMLVPALAIGAVARQIVDLLAGYGQASLSLPGRNSPNRRTDHLPPRAQNTGAVLRPRRSTVCLGLNIVKADAFHSPSHSPTFAKLYLNISLYLSIVRLPSLRTEMEFRFGELNGCW